eukprot:TRINITY_DN630_c0_g1_i1.p1 TRINITY_DN630_c0_g1~~TRINITY_DN630_c0_g1_i1.p1  ORF type:complete len:197 (-),score=52.39 TRINITY_DN630_c0_g1_i1:72-662(-)
MVALFRLSEAAKGRIEIDETDISNVSLHTLRSRLCVIPQDPVLFRGTLRQNLDVLGVHSDGDLWTALASVNLDTTIHAKKEALECEVTESGHNFSIGERQLICLARGLLSKSAVIILDEATASVDLATEEKIHNVIFHQCAKSTMFLIAHRTHTILKCDRVMMLEAGHILGFGTPAELQQSNPVFAALIKKSGWKD